MVMYFLCEVLSIEIHFPNIYKYRIMFHKVKSFPKINDIYFLTGYFTNRTFYASTGWAR